MSEGTLILMVVFGTVGTVSYALIQSGHWISGALLTLILMLGVKVKT